MSQSVTAIPTLFGDPSIDHAVAGLGAGTVATLVMHPLDLVKVRFQLAETPRRISSIQSTSSFSTSPTSTSPGAAGSSFTSKRPGFGTAVYGALSDAVKTDGWKGLYRGLVPNLVGGAGSWGLYFLFYNMIKKQMQGGDPSYRTSSGQHLLAAAEASAITAMLTNPIWVVKTRVFATGKNDPAAFRGLWDGLRTIYRAEGTRGLYKGSLLALVGVSNGSIQFATYEEIKRRRTDIKRKLFAKQGREWKIEDEKLGDTYDRVGVIWMETALALAPEPLLPLINHTYLNDLLPSTITHVRANKQTNTEYILASGSSKFVAIALTYPYQVVRARIQNAPAPTATIPRLTIPAVIRSVWRNESFLGFYKGLGTNALRILPGTCTTFVVYENLVWAFRNLATKNEGGVPA